VPDRNVVDLARRAVSKRSLSTADLKPISQYSGSIDRWIPTAHIVPHETLCRQTALLNAREVIMSASRSTAGFGSLPSPQAPVLAQLHPHPELDVRSGAQTPDTDRPFFTTRTDPTRATPTELSFGPFRLLPTQFLLLEGDKPVHLGSRALEILIVLLERPGELIRKQELMARVWPDIFVEPANLTVHISALRRTLRDGRDGNRFIINVPGRGYSFVASMNVRTPLGPTAA
jgi:DNA-binding winged helix-turn-helix (wHTH) protein